MNTRFVFIVCGFIRIPFSPKTFQTLLPKEHTLKEFTETEEDNSKEFVIFVNCICIILSQITARKGKGQQRR